ncbi:MAG: DUF6279 family lipoprotein [Gammaproteobacteria bacterium]|nr:DUF6279 family lipoprotein [Gammaproteobacteria bacterium]
MPAVRRPLRALAAATIVAVTLAGCSTRFFYDRIDWLIVWKVGDYVTLTDVQRDQLQADIQERLDVLRLGEFPKVAYLLEKTAREIESGTVTPAVIDTRYAEILAVYDQFMLGIVPLAQRFLAGLSEAQLAEFFANLEEVNAEMYEEYSGRTAAEREKNRNKSAIDGMEDWTGRLDESQREIIRAGLARMEDASEQWIANQREWQRRFRDLIVSRPDPATFREGLTQLLVYPRHFHAPEYRARVDANRQIFNGLLAELLDSLDTRQRARAVRKLDNYVALLNRLSESD